MKKTVKQMVIGFGLHGAGAADLRLRFAVGAHLIHHCLPGAGAHGGITSGQIGPGNLKV